MQLTSGYTQSRSLGSRAERAFLTASNRSEMQMRCRAAGSVTVRARRFRWRQIFFPSEYGPAIQHRRRCALGCDEGFEPGSFVAPFEPARLVVNTLQRLHLLVASNLCVPDVRLHDADALVVDLDVS